MADGRKVLGQHDGPRLGTVQAQCGTSAWGVMPSPSPSSSAGIQPCCVRQTVSPEVVTHCSAGGSWEVQAKQLAQPVDVLIGTPQRLLQHAERGNLFWGCVRTAPAQLCGLAVSRMTARIADIRQQAELFHLHVLLNTAWRPTVDNGASSGRCGRWCWTRRTPCSTRVSGRRCERCCGRCGPSRSPPRASSSPPLSARSARRQADLSIASITIHQSPIKPAVALCHSLRDAYEKALVGNA